MRSSVNRREFLQSSVVAGLASMVSAGRGAAQNAKVRPAPMMPQPKSIETNGIRMAVYEKGEGTPIVFCHGFPELAFSWRSQVKAFSEAGYRVLAPDQRGYGLTDRPEPVEEYHLGVLCDDMAGMLDQFEIDKAVFCGHDWGGLVVWSMVRLHPDRCLGVIGVNTPCRRPPSLPPVERESLIVRTENYYARTFGEPGRAEAVLSRDVRKTMKTLIARGHIWNVEAFRNFPEDSPERQMDLLAMIQRDELPFEQFLPEEVIDYFVETFEITGFTGGLNWYRAWRYATQAFENAKWEIDVPCLYIGAEHDVVLPPSSADGMEDFIADLEKYTVKDCGHWTQQEKPEEFNRVTLDWLERKIKT